MLGGGAVQRLGGEPLQPRARQYTGAVPIGGPVQFNQGIAAGQPLRGGSTSAAPPVIPDILTIGIESPAVQQYPAIAVNDVRRLITGLSILNRNPDGTEATAGTAELYINGELATVGESVLERDDYLTLAVTDPGTGILAASIYMRTL